MTIYDFIKLDLNERAQVTWEATFIAERETDEYRTLLYKLDDFFIEVNYQFQENEIDSIRPFTSLRLLEPYLAMIDITDIQSGI